MSRLLLPLFFVLPFLSFSQQRVGHLTVFSEDGDKFFLILNGEKQNTVAIPNIRVEDLTQPFYSAKIVFEDASIEPIQKKNLQISDMNGTLMDVTYRIKKDKGGKVKMTAFSSVEVQPDFVAPQNTTVVHWGAPVQTTTTTTTTTTRNVANASMNVNGTSISINVNDDDPFAESQTTTTTRRTTTTSTTNNNQGNGCAWPMNNNDFIAAKRSVSSASFEDTKLSTAKSIISANCLSVGQVVELCRLFDFEQTKLTFAKDAYSRTIDKNNYFKVSEVFDFDTSKDELNAFISR